jgi:molecular chaperone DnaK (HSP70)
MARYLIGIDLGTTNSALAYIDLQRKTGGRPEVQTFEVPQLVNPGEVKRRPLLPSFLYLPGSHDLPAGATALPWDPQRNYAVGEFARNHGAKVPGRLAVSCRRGSVRRTLALERAAGCAPAVARRGLLSLPAPSR